MTDGAAPERRVRIADADREQAARLLQHALTEGRITVTELDERMRQVYDARFADELEQPFADLPVSPTTAAGAGLVPAATAAAVPVGGAVPQDVLEVSTGWGTIKRDGRWVVPPHLRVKVGAGTVVLDCTQAHLVQRVVTIEVEVRSGTCKLILAPGMTADINGVATRSGTARSKVDAVPDPIAPHFVLRGTVGSGTLVVRRPLFS